MTSHQQFFRAASVAMIAATAALMPLIGAYPAAAQATATLQNVVPESEAVTAQAKISAIDLNTRAVTLVGPSGRAATLTAGPLVRLDRLKTGQTVNVNYYRSVGFIVNPPQSGNGVPVSTDQIAQVTAQPVHTPGGVGLRLTKVSGTVVGIDLSSHSIEVVNPSGGGGFTIDVTDPARIPMLGSLKVGDTVSAVVSEALAVSIDPAPKRWF
jgi:hypothetical protein